MTRKRSVVGWGGNPGSCCDCWPVATVRAPSIVKNDVEDSDFLTDEDPHAGDFFSKQEKFGHDDLEASLISISDSDKAKRNEDGRCRNSTSRPLSWQCKRGSTVELPCASTIEKL